MKFASVPAAGPTPSLSLSGEDASWGAAMLFCRAAEALGWCRAFPLCRRDTSGQESYFCVKRRRKELATRPTTRRVWPPNLTCTLVVGSHIRVRVRPTALRPFVIGYDEITDWFRLSDSPETLLDLACILQIILSPRARGNYDNVITL